MARIRTIKPSFWTSEQVVECSTNARLLFIGIWNFADDGGVIPASVKSLKMQIFPGDDFSASDIQQWVNELIETELLIEYQVDGKLYWAVSGWHHQKIDRPSKLYPAPILTKFADRSTNDPRTLDGRHPPEGRGKEGKGKERKGEEKSALAEFENSTSEKNQKPVLPSPDDQRATAPADDQSGDFEKVVSAIRQWCREDQFRQLGAWRDQCRYDPATHGAVNDEVAKFAAYWLACNDEAKARRLSKNPVEFFRKHFPKWLADAKTYNKPSKSNRPAFSGSSQPNRQLPASVGMEAARTHVQTAHSGFAREFTEKDLAWIAQAKDESEMRERAADKAKQKTQQMKFTQPRNGETSLAASMGSFHIKPEA